jgi:hypothetical protein
MIAHAYARLQNGISHAGTETSALFGSDAALEIEES